MIFESFWILLSSASPFLMVSWYIAFLLSGLQSNRIVKRAVAFNARANESVPPQAVGGVEKGNGLQVNLPPDPPRRGMQLLRKQVGRVDAAGCMLQAESQQLESCIPWPSTCSPPL